MRLPHGAGVVALTPAPDHVDCRLELVDFRDLGAAISRCRRLLDLDADPEAVIAVLREDPRLEPLVAVAPGQRIPRTVDEAELAVRVVLGQQVSMKAARTHTARLVAGYGRPVTDPGGGLTHTFPTVTELAEIAETDLALPGRGGARCARWSARSPPAPWCSTRAATGTGRATICKGCPASARGPPR